MANITPARHCIQNIVFEYIQQVEQLQDEGVRHGPCPSESPGLSSPCAFSGNEYGQDDKDGMMVKLKMRVIYLLFVVLIF